MIFLVRYYKEILLGLIIIALIGFAVWVRGVVADNAAIKKDAKATQEKFDAKVAELDNIIKLHKDIANAIKTIKIRSNSYITSVERSKAPSILPGGTAVLIPGGMPKALPSVFTAITSAN